MKAILAICAFVFLPLFALAQEVIQEPATVDGAISLIGSIISLAKSGQYLAAGSLAVLVVVFILKQFVLPKVGLKPAILPLISAILGVLAGGAIAIYGGATPIEAILALLSGPVASTLWDAAVKYFFPKPEVA